MYLDVCMHHMYKLSNHILKIWFFSFAMTLSGVINFANESYTCYKLLNYGLFSKHMLTSQIFMSGDGLSIWVFKSS